jgi:HlyD family secretion protein
MPRRPPPRLLLAIVVLGLAGLGLWLAWRPRAEDREVLTGYIQADTLYVSAPISGPVEKVLVARGDRVGPGKTLFVVDRAATRAEEAQGLARLDQSRAGETQVQAVLAGAEARAAAAAAQEATARADLARYEAIAKASPGAVSDEQVDAARLAEANGAAAHRAALKEIAADRAAIGAQHAQSAAQAAALAETRVHLGQLSGVAPRAGRVQEVMYETGEWVGANQPIVTLIPDAKVKVRFYVPEGEIGRYHLGDRIRFRCDGCVGGLGARVAFISASPEYTPPVIYSIRMRAKLVFMIEADPDHPETLSPGQPVEVTPAGK